MHRQESLVEKRWNAEYGRGRYSGEAPVEMITRILAAARARNIDRGLYIGCGNGRNYLPLRRAGLDLTGIDISA
jgi:predicted TPR repeat methyltransferase